MAEDVGVFALVSIVIALTVYAVPAAIAGILSYRCNTYTTGWGGLKKWIFIIGAALMWPTYFPYYVTNHFVLTDFAFCGVKPI